MPRSPAYSIYRSTKKKQFGEWVWRSRFCLLLSYKDQPDCVGRRTASASAAREVSWGVWYIGICKIMNYCTPTKFVKNTAVGTHMHNPLLYFSAQSCWPPPNIIVSILDMYLHYFYFRMDIPPLLSHSPLTCVDTYVVNADDSVSYSYSSCSY